MTRVGTNVLVLFPKLNGVVRRTFAAPSGQTGRGSRAQGDEVRRTCQKLGAIDGEDCPDGLLVSDKVVKQFKVFPHLGGSLGEHERR